MIYFLKKLLSFFVTLIIISLMTFSAFALLPGDPARIILGTEAEPLQIAALREELGLNKPMDERYMDWVSGLFRGDLGSSLRYRLPVSDMIGQALPVTALLSAITLIITAVSVIPLSFALSRLHHSKAGIILSAAIQLGASIPSFWMGIILILIFSIGLNILPSGDYIPAGQSLKGAVMSLLLPSLALSAGTAAVVTRYLTGAIIEQMKSDYMRTAIGKGLSRRKALFRHVMRNALLPAVTVLGMIAVDILGGSIIVENVFSLPGIGALLTSGVSHRDFPLVQGLTFYMALTVLVINTLTDMLYTIIDPRLRKE